MIFKTNLIYINSDGKALVRESWPEKPLYSNYVQHTHYYWQVNKFERAKKDYDSAEFIKEVYDINDIGSDYFDFEKAKELITKHS